MRCVGTRAPARAVVQVLAGPASWFAPWAGLVVLLLFHPAAGLAQTTVNGGTITSDTTWTLAGSPYVVTGSVTVASSNAATAAKLTLEPGVEVRFVTGAGLIMGSSATGRGLLAAKGTAALPIVFTSDKATPAAGDWPGLQFRYRLAGQKSELEYVTIQYAGTSGASLYCVADADLSLDHVTIRKSSTYGLRVGSASVVTLTASTVDQNNLSGVYVESGTASVTAQGSTFSANNGYGVFSTGPLHLTSNTFTGNTSGAILASPATLGGSTCQDNVYSGSNNSIKLSAGTLTADATWPRLDAPYVVTGGVTVASSNAATAAKLTVEPGVEMRFVVGATLSMGSSATARGLLVAKGTVALPIVFTSDKATPAAGDWPGLRFRYRLAEQKSELEHAIIEYAGPTGAGVHCVADADLSLDHVTIRKSSTYGLRVGSASVVTLTASTVDQNNLSGVYVESGTASVTAQGSTFSANNGYGVFSTGPLHLTANTFTGNTSGAILASPGTLAGSTCQDNVYSGNNNSIKLSGGTLTGDAVWPRLDAPYVVTGAVTVASSNASAAAKLTVEPGVEARFVVGATLSMGSSATARGLLVAKGTAAQPILFTSDKATPAAGDWPGLRFWYRFSGQKSELEHATIQYAGPTGAGVNCVADADLSLDHVTIRKSSTYGLRVGSASVVTLAASTVDQNNLSGVYVESGTASVTAQGSTFSANNGYGVFSTGSLHLTANTFTGNTSGAILASPGALAGSTCQDNVYSGSNNSIKLSAGTLTADAVWPKLDGPYVVTGAVTVASSNATTAAKLTVEPGVEVRFVTGAGLILGSSATARGLLVAKGTAALPIVFTSDKATPAPGDWPGLRFSYALSGFKSELEYVAIRYAQHGIYSSAGDVVARMCDLYNLSGYGAYNSTGTPVIDATSCWWGDASGPTYAGNPGGSGEAVNAGVLYAPWLARKTAPADDDDDGLTNTSETDLYGTDPFQRDSDGDGINDGAELAYWGAQWNEDVDGDGLGNLVDQDSDGDGMTDGYELANGLAPSSNDGAADEDADGFSNLAEYRVGTRADDVGSVPVVRVRYEYGSSGALGRAVPSAAAP